MGRMLKVQLEDHPQHRLARDVLCNAELAEEDVLEHVPRRRLTRVVVARAKGKRLNMHTGGRSSRFSLYCHGGKGRDRTGRLDHFAAHQV